jgi:chromosome segregation ATPase
MVKNRKQKTGVKGNKNLSVRKKLAAADGTAAALEALGADESNRNSLSDMEQVDSPAESAKFEIEDIADVSEERASIISIVQSLEGQVDTAFELKEALEAELDEVQKKLSEESAARIQLEERLETTKLQAAMADQVRQDLSFTEEERNKLADSLTETQQQLEAVIKERDSLAKEVASVEPRAKELEDEKMTLEAQVMNLKDKVVDMGRLCGELEGLREKLTIAEGQLTELNVHLEDQLSTNSKLVKTRTHLESEVKMLAIKHEAAKNELDAFKKALRDIRSEATRTSGRVRQRYFKLKPTKA